jgi:hypothetical protein
MTPSDESTEAKDVGKPRGPSWEKSALQDL